MATVCLTGLDTLFSSQGRGMSVSIGSWIY